MSVLEVLKWQNFSSVAEDDRSTESKSGIPRYDGDPTKLQEYQFRVRLRQAREQQMDESELKKLGPLALRLVDGLRGPALQVARSLQVDKLANKEGPTYLLEALQSALRPRSKQEARELYQAGAQQGGILSRQFGESIPSYVLRRRAWYQMMTDLDAELKLPELVLAEQVLENSGIGADHKLLIRTAVGSNLTVDAICEELMAQHSRIHEIESRRRRDDYSGFGSGKSSYRSFKGYGNRKPWKGGKAHYVEADYEHGVEHWDAASQSLGGFEEFEDYEVYHTIEESPIEEDVSYALYTELAESGFDENDQEAAEYAAEIIQAESEAYYLRSRAAGSGHMGFNAQKQYSVKGSLTLEERKARINNLKSKTTCRRCGQTGHWAGDPQCPKGKGKKGPGKGFGASSNGSGKGGKSKDKEKPRTVYFTMNEYAGSGSSTSGTTTSTAYMAFNVFGRGSSSSSGATSAAASTPHSEWSVISEAIPGRSEANLTADEMLDAMIRLAENRRAEKDNFDQEMVRAHSQLINSEYDLPPDPPQAFQPDQGRLQYLDHYLALTEDRTSAEWQDAYLERWNQVVPGHPLFCESDRTNLQRWRVKAQLGLPTDGKRQRPDQGEMEQEERHLPPVPEDVSFAPVQGCRHLNVSRQGSNVYRLVRRCKDCGEVLEDQKRRPDAAMADATSSASGSCRHVRKD